MDLNGYKLGFKLTRNIDAIVQEFYAIENKHVSARFFFIVCYMEKKKTHTYVCETHK